VASFVSASTTSAPASSSALRQSAPVTITSSPSFCTLRVFSSPGLLVGGPQIFIDCLAGLFGKFKSDRSAGLLLAYGCAIRSVSARSDIVDFDRHDIAAPKLAVDRQIENREVSDATFNLEFGPD
jgi:hypothetical protein